MDPTVIGSIRVKIRGGSLEHQASGVRLVIDEETPRVVIGRGGSCAFSVKDDRQVSAAHCELLATDQGVKLRDLTSTNGTWVDDLLLGPDQYVLLRRPCTLRVGDSRLAFTPKKDAGEHDVAGKFGPLESRSAKMAQVFDRLEKIASISESVHITGETGTGKSFIARAIHNQSGRASKPFVLIDCSAIPPTLAEAELFGYSKGAFTGATQARESPFVQADGGTVFLDEIGDLSLDNQARLLHVVDEQEVKAIGQNHYRKIDVRVISATVHDLAARVNAGLFREDLYARLTATRIELPPLRDRSDDIEPLVLHILSSLGRADLADSLTSSTVAWLKDRPWTGNVRQLRRVVNIAVDLARKSRFDMETAYSLGPAESRVAAPSPPESTVFDAITARGTSHDAALEQASRILLENLFRETEGNVSEIARRAAISRDYARDLLAKFGLRDVAPRNRKKVPSED